jgi:heme exporter protein A
VSVAGVEVHNVTKRFARRKVFENVNFGIESGTVFGVTGKNGSGKSTLLKIVAGLMSSNSGKITFTDSDAVIDPEKVYRHIGYAAPYITLFEEFSAMENMQLFARIRAMDFDTKASKELLEKLGLPSDRNEPISTFSSGMMQRMRLAFASSHHPQFLFLDEPSSNLDEDGFKVVRSIVEDARKDSCVIIATNDFDDLQLCDEVFSVDGSKPSERS